MRKTEVGKNKVKYIIFPMIAVLLIAAILTVAILWDRNGAETAEYDLRNGEIEYNGKTYVMRYDVDTFLVIGLDALAQNSDKDSYNNKQQADFLMLLVFDNTNESYFAIQVNRDTVAKMDILGIGGKKVGTVEKQIALAHTYGDGGKESNANTANAVSELFCGVGIDHSMSLTLEAVTVMNDLVGGVEVEVLDDFSEIDSRLVKGERVLLDGEMALTYVRSRKGVDDGTNTSRMERQQQYLDALREKLLERAENDPEFVIEANKVMAEYMISNCSAQRLDAIGEKMQEYKFEGIKNLEGEVELVDNLMEFHPDEDKLIQTVIKAFCKEKV